MSLLCNGLGGVFYVGFVLVTWYSHCVLTGAVVLSRSVDQHLLCEAHTKLVTGGERTFQKGAPTLWSHLPFTIRSSNSLYSFKKSHQNMEYRYHLNNLVCNVKQSSIFSYVCTNVTYILTACKAPLTILMVLC